MKVLTVCVGRARPVPVFGEVTSTALYKARVEGPVMVRALGLDGDEQANREVHGGPTRAVYAFPVESYAFWRERLGLALADDAVFGENLTTEGIDEHTLSIGDVLRVGGALLRVTRPRVPCEKLRHRLGLSPDFLRDFMVTGRTGILFSVLEEGAVSAGDAITVEDRDAAGVSVAALASAMVDPAGGRAVIERCLTSTNLDPNFRARLEKTLR